MRLYTISRIKKLLKDPFALLIAAVVLVPALLFAYSFGQQEKTTSANTVPQEQNYSQSADSSTTEEPDEPQPITQAEKPAVEEVLAERSPPPTEASDKKLSCDESKKREANEARDADRQKENALHEKQRDRLRFGRMFTNKYWNQEKSRHQSALDDIDATYKEALAAANCR